MSSSSLIPDRQLTFSPDLAATIGLGEAILLQGIAPQIPQTPGRWHALVMTSLEKNFPFWQRHEILHLLKRLAELGVIAILTEDDGATVRVSLAGEHSKTGEYQPSEHSQGASLQPLQPRVAPEDTWQPSEGVLDLLALNHGIDRQFALSQLANFERGVADRTRDSRFRQHVLAIWRRQQHQHPAFTISEPPKFDADWHPSHDAMEIMVRSGVDPEFIDTLRPEFVLYWREKGGPPKEVNSRFISFVRQRWSRFAGGLVHSTEPTRIGSAWQPSNEVFEILDMAGISRDFARQRMPEFVLYWSDSNEMHTSWNSKFLQHVKHQWRWEQRHGGENVQQQGSSRPGPTGRTRDRSLADDLSDTSWAE